MKRYIAMMLVAMLVFSCTPQEAPEEKEPVVSAGTQTASQELKKFSSAQEIAAYLEANSQQSSSRGSYQLAMVEEASFDGIAAGSMAKTTAQSAPSPGADDYSTTNVQVQGVDEADFVKNDNKYIYVLSGSKLVIVDAYPAEDAQILSETDIKGYPQNMFINGDRLVVFANLGEQMLMIPEYDILPVPRYTERTHVYLYDITDREDPELIKDYSLNGYFYQARMIGDHVYFLVNEGVYYWNKYVDVPSIRDGDKVIMTPEVFYFDNPEYNYNFVTVSSLDIFEEDIQSKSFMMGYSNTLYMSLDNMYVAYQKNYPYWNYESEELEKFKAVILPNLPGDVKAEVEDLIDEQGSWNKISTILEDMYNRMEEDDKEDFVEEMYDRIEEYEVKREIERRKTIIHKLSVDKGTIEYVQRAEVPGYLHNQFAMDEDDGYLRVATTVDAWTRSGRATYNNVYVLDEDMDVVGELEDIAPEESIYSTRFMGDRLYMVTFKRIDPFFVIDLSDPRSPEILGELKIPGYSDYLHPYDEDTVIGIGKETEENSWGGVSTGGVKIALFDVSDVTKPKLLDSTSVGSSGSDSEALYEHKAFLFDKEKELLVLPITEVKERRVYDQTYGYYRNRMWQGAYVFDLSGRSISEKGRISHSETIEDSYYYWTAPTTVRRSLFMDDVLYTISESKIKMHDLEEIGELNEVELPYSQYVYPTPYYKDVVAVDSIEVIR